MTVFAVCSLEYYDRFCSTLVGILWLFLQYVRWNIMTVLRQCLVCIFQFVFASYKTVHFDCIFIYLALNTVCSVCNYCTRRVFSYVLIVFVCFDGYSSRKTVIDYAIFPFSVYFLAYTYIYTPSIFMRHEHRYKHNHAFWVHLLL